MSKKETEPNKVGQGDVPVSDTSPDSFRKVSVNTLPKRELCFIT